MPFLSGLAEIREVTTLWIAFACGTPSRGGCSFSATDPDGKVRHVYGWPMWIEERARATLKSKEAKEAKDARAIADARAAEKNSAVEAEKAAAVAHTAAEKAVADAAAVAVTDAVNDAHAAAAAPAPAPAETAAAVTAAAETAAVSLPDADASASALATLKDAGRKLLVAQAAVAEATEKAEIAAQ